jgi:hypothetical protein
MLTDTFDLTSSSVCTIHAKATKQNLLPIVRSASSMNREEAGRQMARGSALTGNYMMQREVFRFHKELMSLILPMGFTTQNQPDGNQIGHFLRPFSTIY